VAQFLIEAYNPMNHIFPLCKFSKRFNGRFAVRFKWTTTLPCQSRPRYLLPSFKYGHVSSHKLLIVIFMDVQWFTYRTMPQRGQVLHSKQQEWFR
ncbi:hypothetical protein FCV25MIE_16821, partial [Fagus crenata]